MTGSLPRKRPAGGGGTGGGKHVDALEQVRASSAGAPGWVAHPDVLRAPPLYGFGLTSALLQAAVRAVVDVERPGNNPASELVDCRVVQRQQPRRRQPHYSLDGSDARFDLIVPL